MSQCNACVHLYDSIHRTGLLAESTVDAFGHVNVITCCSSAAICTGLCFYSDGLQETKALLTHPAELITKPTKTETIKSFVT